MNTFQVSIKLFLIFAALIAASLKTVSFENFSGFTKSGGAYPIVGEVEVVSEQIIDEAKPNITDKPKDQAVAAVLPSTPKRSVTVPVNTLTSPTTQPELIVTLVKRGLRAVWVNEVDGEKIWTQKFYCDTFYSDGTSTVVAGGGNYEIRKPNLLTGGTVKPPDCPTYPIPTPLPPGVIPN